MTIARRALPILLVIFWIGVTIAGASDIKVALVTPEGSTWTQTLRQMAKEVETATGGEVRFKIYAGGISGDELDVLRKMRVNRIHAAGFSGVGLGVVLPEIRILEAPLLFADDREIDFVKEKLYDQFAKAFEKKGFVLLGFAEAGFVYFYSRQNIADRDGLRAIKMWAWKGDPVAETFLKTFGINTYPLDLTDVNTGLETGMIDSFYSPPLAAVAFQWYSRIRYMLDYPMVNSTGAFLMNRSVFDRLSKKNQDILSTVARKYCQELVRLSRKDNAEALSVLKESGVSFVKPSPELIASFQESARQTYDQNIPGLYSKELFTTVQGLIRTYRQNR